jgi:hypothetical protein
VKIYYAPSGKRMIPYPPMAPAILSGALAENGLEARSIDLEIEAWRQEKETGFWPADRAILDAYRILSSSDWGKELHRFSDALVSLADYQPGERVAISIMGFEQLASAAILTRIALQNDSRVILGGQYWTDTNACRVLQMVADSRLTIVTSDGYEAIVQWATSDDVPTNGWRWVEGHCIEGQRKAALTQPPVPHYPDVNWSAYDEYAGHYLGSPEPTRRAHLYVWDKQCPYKCTFCRVSTGSSVKLSPPETIAQNMALMLDDDVRQFNFMTNEINPTLKYMRRFLNALEPHLAKRPDVAWFTYMRPDNAEEEDFRQLSRSPLF